VAPWIDPRERRARWYFSSLLLLGVGTLLGMIFLLILGDKQTSEERVLTLVTAALAAIGVLLAALKLKRLSGEFQQQEDRDSSSGSL
jgi:uncharacterized membrane protein YdjX (TVP38/TMEM64 family)